MALLIFRFLFCENVLAKGYNATEAITVSFEMGSFFVAWASLDLIIDQAGLQFAAILLPLPLEYWDDRCVITGWNPDLC